MKLVVGLGNPGPGYRNTRHNIGFVVLDRLAERLGAQFGREKFKGVIAEARAGGDKVLLLKPQTFMNLSGESVAMAARNGISEDADLLVIYDDVELPLGRIRMRAGGSAGTHNGMRSVVERVGHREIPRLRIGVGRDIGGAELTRHVLGKFRPEERAAVDELVERATDAALAWAEEGMTMAMNRFNGSEPEGGK